MIIKLSKNKKCSSCGSIIKEYDTEKNVDYQGFLHCNNCLQHCITYLEYLEYNLILKSLIDEQINQ